MFHAVLRIQLLSIGIGKRFVGKLYVLVIRITQVQRATQKDIARRAGVSQATVSMVMKGQYEAHVSESTVKRILAVANELGYAPNRFAQALKTRRSMTVALVVPDITNPFYPSLMRGIQNVTDASNYDLMTINTDGSAVKEKHFLSWVRQGRVDGVIGVFFSLRTQDFKPLSDDGIAVVRIEAKRRHGGKEAVDNLFVDNQQAARTAIKYLLRSGHRNIAMLAGRGGPDKPRIQGYQIALEHAQLQPCLRTHDFFNETGGYELTHALFEEPTRPTAVFAANDLMAIGALQALRERSLKVPDDVSVMGFDDIPAARLVHPSLSTVAQFEHRLGERAAQVLLSRLGSDSQNRGTAEEMPFKLIKRESTARLRKPAEQTDG